MSLRTLLEDSAYRGGGLLLRLIGAWRAATPKARLAVVLAAAAALALWWLGPRLGLYGEPRGGFTAEELRLMNRSGSTGADLDGLPWWYRQGE